MYGSGVAVLIAYMLMAQQGTLVTALPRMTTRQLAPANFQARPVHEAVCKHYMETCVPWETGCCNNMECMNLARGYCLYPLEKCLCQKISVDFY